MSSSAQDFPLDLNLGNTFGALLIGVILAAVLVNSFLAMQSKLISLSPCISRNSLFGVTNVQAFIYFQTHNDTGMTGYKWIVRPCYVLFSSVLYTTSGHLVVVCIL
jgi:hypothetical protein